MAEEIQVGCQGLLFTIHKQKCPAPMMPAFRSSKGE